MGGAKNHGIVLPDADLDQAVKDIIGAAYGSAGERCMALPVVVPVGEKTADDAARAAAGRDRDPEGRRLHRRRRPVRPGGHGRAPASGSRTTSSWASTRAPSWCVDGRGFALQGYENGFFIGPTLFDHVKPTMKTYQDEIFGPVLQIVRAESFEEALALPSNHQYGNGVAIFTRNGRAAREFAARVNVGMVGINVPIPVPVAYHTFGGWKRSAFGDTNQHGMEGVRFYTKVKTVTARWPESRLEGEFELRHPDDALSVPLTGPRVDFDAQPRTSGAHRGRRRAPSPRAELRARTRPLGRGGASSRSTCCARPPALGFAGLYVNEDVGGSALGAARRGDRLRGAGRRRRLHRRLPVDPQHGRPG